MFSIGSFSATLGLDNTQYVRGILQSQAVTTTFGATFAAFVTNPLLGGIQVMQRAGAAMVRMGADVLASAESVQRLSQQTGLAVETIQALRQQAALAGHGATIADKALEAFSRRMGQAVREGGSMAQAFEDVVGSLDQFTSVDQALRATLDAIERMPDASQRAAAAGRLFGEEMGGKLLNVIGGGADALDRLIEKWSDVGQVMGREAVDRLAELNTVLGFTRAAADGVARSAIGEFLVGLTGDAELSEEAVAKLALSIRNELVPAVREFGEALNENRDILVLTLETMKAIGQAVNWGASNLRGASTVIGQNLDSAMLDRGYITNEEFNRRTARNVQSAAFWLAGRARR